VIDKGAERVLVIPAEVLRRSGPFQGFSPDVERYLPALLDPAHFRYLPRSAAETDPSFKQLIPYVVLRWGEQVFHYTRGHGGGEARLRALRSVGVGGHICAEDGVVSGDDYRLGMLRELHEEVHLDGPYTEHRIGLINDDRTPVGQVHLGIVHVLDLQGPYVRRREDVLTEDGFAPVAQLIQQVDRFETWSQFLLEGGWLETGA
jgi:predicted NUDIX family phosphoesterase